MRRSEVELLAERGDRGAQRLGVRGLPVTPDLGEEGAVGEDATGVAGEHREQGELLAREVERDAVDPGLVARGVDAQRADVDTPRRRSTAASARRCRAATVTRASSSGIENGFVM